MRRIFFLSLLGVVVFTGGAAFAADVAFNDDILEAMIESQLVDGSSNPIPATTASGHAGVDGVIDSADLDGTSGAGQMGNAGSGLIGVLGGMGGDGPEPLIGVTDLTGLQACPNLSLLMIAGGDVQNWAAISALSFPQIDIGFGIPLAAVMASNCAVDDADIVAMNLAGLVSTVNVLSFENDGPGNANTITDASMGTIGAGAYFELGLSGNPGITDISPLTGQSTLGAFGGVSITDCGITTGLSAVQTWLPSIERLDLSGNALADLSGLNLTGFGGLREIRFENNSIASLAGLDLSANGSLEQVYFGGNAIVDISPLATINPTSGKVTFDLANNQIADIHAFVAKASQINYINLNGNPLSVDACCVDRPDLQAASVSLDVGSACDSATFNVTVTIVGNGIVTVGGSTVTSGVAIPLQCNQMVWCNANPAPSWNFSGWTGDVTDTNQSINFNLDGDKNLTATFTEVVVPKVNLTIEITGHGTTVPAAGVHQVNQNEWVNLEATPEAGYGFLGWLIDGNTNTSLNTGVFMDTDKTVTANFTTEPVPKVTLSIASEGQGTTDPVPGDYQVNQLSYQQVSATANPGYVFVGWTGTVSEWDAIQNPLNLYMNEAKSITAHFEAVHPVTVTINTVGNGTSDPVEGVYTQDLGTSFHVEGTAAPGGDWEFWEFVVETDLGFRRVGGTGTGLGPYSTDIQLLGDTIIWVRFRETESVTTRTVYLTVVGGGTTDPPPGNYTLPLGSNFKCKAVEKSHWRFDQWLSIDIGPAPGEPPRTNPNESIYMDYSKIITARFVYDEDFVLPVGGLAGMAGLAAMMAVSGVAILRRRKK
ncbi:MAG TPA: hypothetical protein PLI09_21440 [Candidatus Hydrogenedentes bacterium]|nr:hypothetical protein [Candidatus Hydrogenedentota bacterium]